MSDEASSDKSRNKSKKKKVRNRRHRHIGPNVRAFKSGRAICLTCDWQKLEAKKRTKTEVTEEVY